MDIVRASTDAGLERGVTIQGTSDDPLGLVNTRETYEDPLFQASQIGALLGLVNIRETIKEFDGDETRVSLTRAGPRYSSPSWASTACSEHPASPSMRTKRVSVQPGPQSTQFLTELGLYRLLGMSRKPFTLGRPT
jgi:hypothetical protein